MINILFLMESLTCGGAEKVMNTLANNLDPRQFRVTVQTIEASSPEGILAPGIRYQAMNRCKTPVGKKLYSLWLRFCAEAKLISPLYIRGNYDIEVACLECAPTKFLWGSTRRKALKLAWVHCDLQKKGILPTSRNRRIYQSYDRVICVSQDTRSAFLALFGNCPPSCVLQNVLDEQEILSKAHSGAQRQREGYLFVAAGRLAHQKGIDRLIDACHMLQRDSLNFRLEILGEGPERPALEKQIRDLGLQDTVTLSGFAENPYPVMKSADCIVCSSRYEGFSTIAAEALILGKPIVTTPCTGMGELLGDSRYGLITEDTTEGLYHGMAAMLKNPDLNKRYAEAALQRSALFSKEASTEAIAQFFLAELSRKRSGI